jgi:hypothetical protein
MPAVAAVPPDAHSLAGLPIGYIVANGVDYAGDFMSWNARVRDARVLSLDRERIRVTNAACLDSNSNIPTRWRRQLSFDNLQFFGLTHLDGAIGFRCHCLFLNGIGGALRLVSVSI